MKTDNLVDGLFLAIGTGYSLSNIQTVLGVILLVLQIVWIIAKIVIKVIRKAKTGEPVDILSDEVDDALEAADKLIEKIGDLKKGGDENDGTRQSKE